MTEPGIRKALAKQGYKLHKVKNSYRADGYYITDINHVIVTNHVNSYNLSFKDVENWLKE